MNYQSVYNSLISKAQAREKPECYTEQHHIVPTALGGLDTCTNLVHLTAREHCLAHLLLAKIHGGKMWYPVTLMTKNFKITSRAYEFARVEISKKLQGPGNPMFGKTGKNHPRFGKKATALTKSKISKTKIDRGLSKGENNPRARAIWVNGIFYATIQSAAQSLGIKDATLRMRVHRNPEQYSEQI